MNKGLVPENLGKGSSIIMMPVCKNVVLFPEFWLYSNALPEACYQA